MNEYTLRKALSSLPLGGLQYFEKTSSTNDVALAWAADGALDLSLVFAEEQTAGRGRGSHSWFTPPEAALAFSLVIRPLPEEQQTISLFSALGALAVCEVLAAQGLQPEIKWPNDVLINRRKASGILVESIWTGERVDSLVLGIGLNIRRTAVPPPDQLTYPATCMEAELPSLELVKSNLEQGFLLQQILKAMVDWRRLITKEDFLHALENNLAFCGEEVEIWVDGQPARKGQVDGLEEDGSLRLLSPLGQTVTVKFGEVHLRPVV